MSRILAAVRGRAMRACCVLGAVSRGASLENGGYVSDLASSQLYTQNGPEPALSASARTRLSRPGTHVSSL